MEVIVEGKAKGVNRNRTCRLLQIEERRVRHWFSRPTLADTKPGPMHAPHALLPEERMAIVAIAKDERYVDDSHRVLTAKCVDSGKLAVSASTVYRVMRTRRLDHRPQWSQPPQWQQPQAGPPGAYRAEPAVVLGYQLFADVSCRHVPLSLCAS